MSPSSHRDRISDLAREAERASESFVPPENSPDEARAERFLREGFGPTLSVYIEARSGEPERFGEAEFAELERTMNVWLELYAACYGVEDFDADFTVREAAEALVDTHNVYDVARVLTSVPERDRT